MRRASEAVFRPASGSLAESSPLAGSHPRNHSGIALNNVAGVGNGKLSRPRNYNGGSCIKCLVTNDHRIRRQRVWRLVEDIADKRELPGDSDRLEHDLCVDADTNGVNTTPRYSCRSGAE